MNDVFVLIDKRTFQEVLELVAEPKKTSKQLKFTTILELSQLKNVLYWQAKSASFSKSCIKASFPSLLSKRTF